jgi:hypothetical protein
MAWRGLEMYGRRVAEDEADRPYEPADISEDDDAPRAAIKADKLRELRDLDSRMQGALDAAVEQGLHRPDQFYSVNTARGQVTWLYNPPYAELHFLEMHPYNTKEC